MTTQGTAHFYVDESGDLTLFGRRGRSLLGREGVSWCFMVGMARIADPEAVRVEMGKLRKELMADPYLSGVCSMKPDGGKTAVCFHAKNDCPEVRMAVFKLLARHDIKVQVGIRRKKELLPLVHQARALNVRWNSDTVYDDMVKTLFKRSLHKAEENVICFARRGKSARDKALGNAVERAKINFQRDTGIASDKPTRIISRFPSEETGLQVIDYFLWAVQRLYERREDRYFNFVANHYSVVMDFDDRRNGKTYGTWYSDRNPLAPEKIMPVTG